MQIGRLSMARSRIELVAGFTYCLLRLCFGGYSMMVLVFGGGGVLGSWNTPFPQYRFSSVKLTTGTAGAWSGNLAGDILVITENGCAVIYPTLIRWISASARVDQLSCTCWKVLFPIMLCAILLTGFVALWMADEKIISNKYNNGFTSVVGAY